MPKLVNKVPVYGLHKASGQARVKHHGKCTYLGKYGTPESKELYARFIANLPKPDDPPALAEPLPGVVLTMSVIACYATTVTLAVITTRTASRPAS